MWIELTVGCLLVGALGIIAALFQRSRSRELADSKFRTLSETALDGVVMADDHGNITFFNPSAERLFGLPRAQVLGRPLTILMPERFVEPHKAGLGRTLSTGETRIIGRTVEVAGRRADGTEFPVEVSLTRGIDGGHPFFMAHIRDISAQKKVDRLKNEFISTVSHEIRTPMTSIHGSLGLLESGVLGVLPPKAKPLVDIAYKNSDRLIRLINDILDIEKIESGGMPFQVRELELAGVVDQAVDSARGFAENLGVTIETEIADAHIRVEADADRLSQVLTNLLSNAAKFSPQDGVIRVAVRRREDWVRVSVTDHGPGIAPAFQGRIFEKFAQGVPARDQRKSGTGLGLSIARAIVERLGGKIGFECGSGAGTTFHVDLRESKPVRIETGPIEPGARRLLVCEDDSDLCQVVSALLAEVAEVRCARGLEEAKRRVWEDHYDLVLLDLTLPDGSGLELLPFFAECGRAAPPVVVFSAREADPEVARRVAAFLVKSKTSEAQLRDTILSLLPRPAPGRKPAGMVSARGGA